MASSQRILKVGTGTRFRINQQFVVVVELGQDAIEGDFDLPGAGGTESQSSLSESVGLRNVVAQWSQQSAIRCFLYIFYVPGPILKLLKAIG